MFFEEFQNIYEICLTYILWRITALVGFLPPIQFYGQNQFYKDYPIF